MNTPITYVEAKEKKKERFYETVNGSMDPIGNIQTVDITRI